MPWFVRTNINVCSLFKSNSNLSFLLFVPCYFSFNNILSLRYFTVHSGQFHGDIIRFNAGATFNITYRNLLTNPLGNEVNNEYRLPNTTNLHLHGSHISPKSPGDNVKLFIQPQEEYKFEYEFPLNHAPGTYWYHPHLHGSGKSTLPLYDYLDF